MKTFSLSALVAFTTVGCATVSPWEQAGAEFGKGMITQIDKDAPKTVETIFKSAGDGIRQEVLTDATNEKVAQTIGVAAETTRAQLPLLREELIGKQSEEQLQRLVLTLMTVLEARSKRLSRGVMDEVGAGLQDDILNAETEKRLNEMLVSLGATARGESQLLRDELLSAKTDAQMRVIVATAMGEVVNASEQIRQKAREELTFVQKNANETILLAAVVGAVIAFFIWRQKEKNRILLSLLMGQIHASSRDKEDEILARLETQAKQLGVTGPLRSALSQRRRSVE